MKGPKGITGELALKEQTGANPQPFPDPFVNVLRGVGWGLGRGPFSRRDPSPISSSPSYFLKLSRTSRVDLSMYSKSSSLSQCWKGKEICPSKKASALGQSALPSPSFL